MATTKELYACPCCGAKVFEDIGEYEVCDDCGWEDDPLQREDPDDDLGANTLSLNQYRAKFADISSQFAPRPARAMAMA